MDIAADRHARVRRDRDGGPIPRAIWSESGAAGLGRGDEHSKAGQPRAIVGSWFGTTPTGLKQLITFHADGTVLRSVPGEVSIDPARPPHTSAHGVWRYLGKGRFGVTIWDIFYDINTGELLRVQQASPRGDAGRLPRWRQRQSDSGSDRFAGRCGVVSHWHPQPGADSVRAARVGRDLDGQCCHERVEPARRRTGLVLSWARQPPRHGGVGPSATERGAAARDTLQVIRWRAATIWRTMRRRALRNDAVESRAGGRRERLAGAREALSALCQTYWYPLYAYLRRRGLDPEDARDLTQGFLTSLIERQDFEGLRQDRGRFRAFLLASLKHYLRIGRHVNGRRSGAVAGRWSRSRTPRACTWSSRWITPLPKRSSSGAGHLTVVDCLLADLRAQWTAQGRASEFDELKACLLGQAPAGGYAAVAARLGTSEGAVKAAVHRLRRRFQSLLRQRVAETVADGRDVDDEIRHLIQALSA